MRTNLRVPFADKDEAKRLGARWDPAKKLWYVQNVPNLAAFERWLPAQAERQRNIASFSPAACMPSKKARVWNSG